MHGQTEPPGQETTPRSRAGAAGDRLEGRKEGAAKQGWRRCLEEEERAVGSVGGRERAEAAGARLLRRPIPPRPAELGERGAGGMEVGMPCVCAGMGAGSGEAAASGVLRHSHPSPPAVSRAPEPRPRCSRTGIG